MLDQKRLKKFEDSEYRASYLEGSVRSGISYQIKALRAKDDLTQKGFADAIGTTQSVVSRLENPDYGKVTVQTLLDIAIARDVALVVRFVDYPTFFGFADRMAEDDLQPASVYESIAKASVPSPAFETRHFKVEMTDGYAALNLRISSDRPDNQIELRASDNGRMFYAK